MIPAFYFHSIYRDVLGLYINQTFLDNLKNGYFISLNNKLLFNENHYYLFDDKDVYGQYQSQLTFFSNNLKNILLMNWIIHTHIYAIN